MVFQLFEILVEPDGWAEGMQTQMAIVYFPTNALV